MENPYIEYGNKFVSESLTATAPVEVKSEEGRLSDRLQEFAFYMTEQAKVTGDALLVMDLHDAVKALRGVGK